ncbi:MAG: tripartite tricarboxylate transporter substrate binding protein [Proteobacteria bacterium]|nr:tripartite tricarboxylate transporter substrate binding protein [Pseudomonadota bacterium]
MAMQLNRRRACATAVALGAALASGPARAQAAYPSRPVRIIVPFAPGGGTDFAARAFSAKLAERLGQPVVVENKPGAASTLGTVQAVRAPADGYTLLAISGSYVVNPSLYKLSFDPINDVAPIIQLTESGYVLAVHPSVPARNLGELIELMRRRPGELNYASSGQGGHLQVVTEYLLELAKATARHIPYRGTGPAVLDLLAGRVEMMFGGTEALMQHVAAGRLRAIAVGTPRRLAAFPDLPTVAESGLPGYEVVAWHGMLAPRDTPPEIVALLNRHLHDIARDKSLNEKIRPQGVDGAGGTPEQFKALLKLEIERYAKVIRDPDIKAGE